MFVKCKTKMFLFYNIFKKRILIVYIIPIGTLTFVAAHKTGTCSSKASSYSPIKPLGNSGVFSGCTIPLIRLS